MERVIQFQLVNAGNVLSYINAHPIYSNDFGIVVEKEEGQVFFREKLNNNLTFVDTDFAWIIAQGFNALIIVDMAIFDDGIESKRWRGQFSRTDCTINEVDKIIRVTPSPTDNYTKILDVLDVEFDLKKLPIPQNKIQINVPPILQIYYPGDDYISNYWQGEIWEMEVEPISNTTTLESMGFRLEDFVHYTIFYCRILHSSSGTDEVNDMYNVNNSAYKYWNIFDHWTLGFGIVESTNFSNNPTIYGQVYDAQGQPTGQYYAIPVDAHYVYVPLRPRTWNSVDGSMWLRIEVAKTTDIDSPMQTISINDSYTIGGVIRALLSANSLSINFLDNVLCSQFLYGSPTPITSWASGWRLNVTAKSNIIKLGAVDLAKKIPCTLNTIFNFLKNALNVYWSIETVSGATILKLEHISYYKNGGSYNGSPVTQFDLTQLKNPRNNKPWAFGQNVYQFEKYKMPEFVKWEWMDESDDIFDGSGFVCKSQYVNKGNTEEINIANITTNISKIIMMPDNFSLDGLAVIWTAANNRTDYYYFTRDIGGNWRVPNGQLSMEYLQKSVLLYNAPCAEVEVSGTLFQGVDYVRTKYNDVTFPAQDVDPIKHITTNVGDGAVDSVTNNIVNQSVKVKLKYPNE